MFRYEYIAMGPYSHATTIKALLDTRWRSTSIQISAHIQDVTYKLQESKSLLEKPGK
jgi:hypothetical protein